MLIRPQRLEPGDTLGIVAPASAPPDPKSLDRAVAVLEKLGFRVKLAPNARRRRGFLAGSDRERAGDLMRLFTDRGVKAIVCVRGGYGTARLLPLLDYRVIRGNPKILVGYSDITSLHCAMLTEANLISFHGPMLNSDFVNEDIPAFTLQSFLRTLALPPVPLAVGGRENSPNQDFALWPPEPAPRPIPQLRDHPLPHRGREQGAGATGNRGVHGEGIRRTGAGWTGNISQGYRGKTIKVLRRGVARGQLIGGNLSLLCTTLGTPWQPPFRGRILFFEDVGEQPYRFDRMLTHLLNCGLLQQVAGIAIGINHDCADPQARRAKEFRQTLEDVLKERLMPLKVPVVMGLPFGHVPQNATLPVGARALLDGNNGDLLLIEAAVS